MWDCTVGACGYRLRALVLYVMRQLFRLNDTATRHPAVVQWLEEHQDPLGILARHWFAALRTCGQDVQETLHDGQLTVCVANAAFAYVDVFRSHANIGFFHGAELPDPAHLLQGSGKYMRHVKLRLDADVDAAALSALIHAAYIDVKIRLAAS
jgi:hypothetical protein